jgi:hypothetical protein
MAVALTGCGRTQLDYGFRIDTVTLQPGYQKILASFSQQLKLSRDAMEALENGVPLTVRMEMELRDSTTLTLLADDIRRFEIRYLPLSQRYELTAPGDGGTRSFPRLRHVLSALSSVNLTLGTGALAPGNYEFRTRIRLENGRLPAPMRLPALLSDQWQHDSEWSTWPFDISV